MLNNHSKIAALALYAIAWILILWTGLNINIFTLEGFKHIILVFGAFFFVGWSENIYYEYNKQK